MLDGRGTWTHERIGYQCRDDAGAKLDSFAEPVPPWPAQVALPDGGRGAWVQERERILGPRERERYRDDRGGQAPRSG
jgi:hypothetical protein